MSPQEENALAMLRQLVENERGRYAFKQTAAGIAADKQLPLITDPIDEVAIRALLVDWNIKLLGSHNRQQSADGTGRTAEEVRTPDGTLGKEPLQLTLWEADAVIARKRDLAAGITFEAEYLQALRDLAADRAKERGLDPDETEIIIGEYVDRAEARDLRAAMTG